MRHLVTPIGSLIVCSALSLLQPTLPAQGRGASFDGDNADDLAVGAPSFSQGGEVNILMGSSGLMVPASFVITGTSLAGTQPGDDTGAALASGDFNGDGFGDLAIGCPMSDVDFNDDAGVSRTVAEAGCVAILPGGSGGLDASRAHMLMLDQGKPGVSGVPETGDRFGAALCAGDFNHDGVDDLAVGVPGESIGNVAGAGCVHVFTGKLNEGLSPSRDFSFDQDSSNLTTGNAIDGVAETHDLYGSSLCAVDFDGDGVDDLAIGIPGEDLAGITSAGSVNVVFGFNPFGLGPLDNLSVEGDDSFGDVEFAEGALAVSSGKFVLDTHENWGDALAAGRLAGDDRDFLAIGIPGKRVFGHADAGAVARLEAGGGVNVVFLCQDGGSIFDNNSFLDDAEDGEEFGSALAAGDFNRDGSDDLAVGVPDEKEGLFGDPVGGVEVFPASEAGAALRSIAVAFLPSSGGRLITQGSDGIPGKDEKDDKFGCALAAGDYIGNGTTDLAIGARHETIGHSSSTVERAGSVWILRGTHKGLSHNEADNQSLSQNSSGMPQSAEEGAHFGSALSSR